MTISGAKYQEGIAFSQDGAMYVALPSGSTIPSPTFTGVGTFADGALAAPSIAFTNAATTGFSRVSNRLLIGVGGAEAMAFAGSFAILPSTGVLCWTNGTAAGSSADTTAVRAGAANSIAFAGATQGAGAVTSRTEINKSVTAFSNAVAKTVFTIAIPAASHSASIEIQVTGSLGAGGAVGANEASATNKYVVTVTKVTGVAATAAISSAYGAAATAVAGAATVTATAALGAVAGGTGANTVDIQVTISRSGGSSDNHTCVAYALLLNANATGVTIS